MAVTRLLLTLTGALLTAASAQSSTVYPASAACPGDGVQISVLNVGEAVAENLDTDGDTTLLFGACFVRNGVAVHAATLHTSGGVTDGAAVSVSDKDLKRIPSVPLTNRENAGLPTPRPEPVSLPLASLGFQVDRSTFQSESV